MEDKLSLSDLASQALVNELEADTEKLAGALATSLPGNYTNLSKDEYLDYWRRNWQDKNWRAEQLDRIGPDNFVKTTYAAFGHEQPKWDDVAHKVQVTQP